MFTHNEFKSNANYLNQYRSCVVANISIPKSDPRYEAILTPGLKFTCVVINAFNTKMCVRFLSCQVVAHGSYEPSDIGHIMINYWDTERLDGIEKRNSLISFIEL